MKKSTIFRMAFVAVLALACGISYAVDPSATMAFMHHLATSPEAGLTLLGMGTLGGDAAAAIKDAIDQQNRAFEEFKKVNDQRLEKMAKGEAISDLEAKLNKAFDEMREQKRAVEDLMAKGSRPNFAGNDGGQTQDEAEHKQAFNGYLRKGRDAGLSELEAKALGITTNSGTDGGYAVPKVIDSMIEAYAINISAMRKVANVVQVGTSDYHKLVNTRGTSSGWVGETDARGNTNTPKLQDIKPPMGEIYAFPQATQQMLDDVFFNAEDWLAGEVAIEFERAEGAAFIAGDGANKPRGFLSETSAATADGVRAWNNLQYLPTGVAGDFAASNPGDLFFDVVASLKKQYRAGSIWTMPKATLFKVAKFKDSQGRYIFNPMTAPDVPENIIGYGVEEMEDMPAIAANSLGIAFGNFKRGYTIVDRIGTRVLRDALTAKPYIGFYVTKRVGGSVTNYEAIKLVKFAVS